MPKCQRHPASPTPALGRQPSSPTPTPGRQSTSPNPTPGWQSLSLDPPAGWQPSSPTPVRSPHAQLIQRRAAEAKERQAQMDEAWGALLAHDDHPDAAAAAAAAAAPPPVAAAHSASPGSGGSNEQRTVSPPASPSTSTTGGTATTPTSVIGGDQAVGEPAADPLTPKPGPGQGQQQTTLSQSSSPKWGASWKHLLGSGRRLKGWSSSGVVTMRDGDSNELAARHNSLGAAGSGARRNSIGSQDHARTGGSLPRGSVTSAGSSRRGMCRSLSLSDGLLAAAAANIAGVDAHEADASDEPSAEPLPVCPTPLKAHAASLGGPNPSPDGSESPDSPRVPLGPFDCPALQAPPESAADGPTMGMGADEALSGTRTGADEGVSGTTTGAGGIFTGKMTRSGSRTAHLADGMDSIADFRTRDSMAQGSPAFGSSPEFAIYSCPIPSLPSPEYAAAGSASQSAPLRGHSGNPRGGLCRRGTPRVVSSSSSCSDLQHLQSTAARASALQASPPAPPLTALHSAATLPPRSDSSPAMIGHPKDGRSLNGYPKRGPLLRMLSASCSDLQHLQAVALPAPPLAPAPRAPLRSPLTVALTVAATAPPTAPLASPPHTVAPAAALPPSSPQDETRRSWGSRPPALTWRG
ncbi:hypothetical protein CLOP_g25269 [Closterium sp. NIES-67]|nr:hypothetical protein CLOP_g25269 [Closterium sp. NIES-67]